LMINLERGWFVDMEKSRKNV